MQYRPTTNIDMKRSSREGAVQSLFQVTKKILEMCSIYTKLFKPSVSHFCVIDKDTFCFKEDLNVYKQSVPLFLTLP